MSWLERTAYICLIALCLISGSILISNKWEQHKALSRAQIPNAQTLIGKKLEVPGVDWKSSPENIVLFLSTECRYCEASMPFYRQLLNTRHQVKNNQVAIIGLSRMPVLEMEAHLAKNHVGFDRDYQVPTTFNLLTGTPTLLIIDSTGTIRRAFLGQLNPSQEQQVLSSLGTDGVVAKEEKGKHCTAPNCQS